MSEFIELGHFLVLFWKAKLPHTFKIDQILQLLDAAKRDGELPWLLILVTFLHALRNSEAVGLKAHNVVGERLVVKRKKGSNPVDDELYVSDNPLLNEREALIALARRTRGNQKLFPICERTFQRWVHRYGAAAGLPELWAHPHTLKHSILTYLRQTMGLDEVQDRSGHVSLDSLRIYLKPDKAATDQQVRDALNRVAFV
jgi:integrase